MLPCNIAESAGDICPADEHDAFDLQADRRQRGADVVTAIEKGGEPGPWNGLARRGDERPEPPRAHITAGVGRAGQNDCATRSRRDV